MIPANIRMRLLVSGINECLINEGSYVTKPIQWRNLLGLVSSWTVQLYYFELLLAR